MSEAFPHQPVLEMEGAQIAALRDPSLVLLENVSWQVQPGEFWVVAGPPHAGKSDLLLHAAGLVAPVSGVCRVFGLDTSEFDETQIAGRLRVGFVFADGKLFNHLTLTENIALPLQYHSGLPEPEIANTVAAVLDLLELAPWAGTTPGNLAAVWRQRAALGRALILKPDLLLLDNPSAGLTMRHRQWLVNFLDQLWRGHPFLSGRPATIVVTAEDLHAWEHPQRRFAAVHEGAFSVLGSWGGADFARHAAVRELLAAPAAPEGHS